MQPVAKIFDGERLEGNEWYREELMCLASVNETGLLNKGEDPCFIFFTVFDVFGALVFGLSFCFGSSQRSECFAGRMGTSGCGTWKRAWLLRPELFIVQGKGT